MLIETAENAQALQDEAEQHKNNKAKLMEAKKMLAMIEEEGQEPEEEVEEPKVREISDQEAQLMQLLQEKAEAMKEAEEMKEQENAAIDGEKDVSIELNEKMELLQALQE